MPDESSSGDGSASEDQVRLGVSLSTDRDGFMRRTCPSCGRDFKTDYDEADLGSALAPQIRRIGREIGVPLEVGEEEDEQPEAQLFCPYCGCKRGYSEMFTEDAIRYLHRHIMREIVLPMLDKTFSRAFDREGRSRTSGGLVSMSLEYNRSLQRCRPIHGPEPPDMKTIAFLCCGRRAKVASRRHQVEGCPYCKTAVVLV